MGVLVLEDAREYIFPLFLVDAEDNSVDLASRVFLGTAFFVSKQGDAVTANHVIPKPDALPPGKRVVAVVQQGPEQTVCWLAHAASFEACDLALIHVNIQSTKYLPISDAEVPPGTDVQLIGVPSHEVWMSGKEMRILKGHVTMAATQLELNIAIPLGMSGSPVFSGNEVIAYATKTVKSEEFEDYDERVELLSNEKEQIRITKVTRVTQYGMAFPFFRLRGQASLVFDGKTFMQLVRSRNGES